MQIQSCDLFHHANNKIISLFFISYANPRIWNLSMGKLYSFNVKNHETSSVVFLLISLLVPKGKHSVRPQDYQLCF